MKKITTLLIPGILFSFNAFSQVSFCHSLGASLYVNSITAGGGIMYSPRLNFLEFDYNSTLSAGTHLGVGFSGSASSQAGASGTLTFDFPVVVEYNYGLAATPDADDDFGFFGGAGFGYNLMGGSDDGFGGGTYGGSSYGPVVNAGMRAYIAQKALGLRLSYLHNIKEDGASTFGLGVFYMIGDF